MSMSSGISTGRLLRSRALARGIVPHVVEDVEPLTGVCHPQPLHVREDLVRAAPAVVSAVVLHRTCSLTSSVSWRNESIVREGVRLELESSCLPIARAMKPSTITVMNTGEAADEFVFDYQALAAGWTSVADLRTLGDHQEAQSVPAIVPAADAPTA